MARFTYEQNERGRWRAYRDGKPVYWRGRQVAEHTDLDGIKAFVRHRYGEC